MVFFPFTLCNFTIRIYNFSSTVKHRFSKLSFINFSIFPFKPTRAIYLIIFEVTFQHSILCLNRSLTLSLSMFKLSIVFYATFGLNSSKLIMHQTFTKLAVVLASSVIPHISTGTFLYTWIEPSSISCILFIVLLDTFTLRMSIFPSTFKSINIFVCEYTLSIHCWIFHFSFVISSIWEHNNCFIIISLTVLKFALIISSVLKYCDSKSVW